MLLFLHPKVRWLFLGKRINFRKIKNGLIQRMVKSRVRFLIIEAQKIFQLRKSRTPKIQQYIKNLNLVLELSSQKIKFP